MKKAYLLTALTLVAALGITTAHDRIDHFKGKPSETVAEAKENLSTYNQNLHQIITLESIQPEQMVEIHQLTYTLEIAIAKLQETLQEVADTLEEVHLGSETFDEPRVRENAKVYLHLIEQLLKNEAPSLHPK
ncbi:MAG TPA: hypothetical protein PKE55_14675 [Kiritimatiellia bacterium]|nr:hypothetical protein [Kiritimatiellia bacterium]